jgi:hypothetical protein
MCSFLLQPGLDLAHHFSQKGNTLQDINAGSFGQHVLILSDSDTVYNKINAVIFGNLYYEAHSVCDAVDICLKSAFVFGLIECHYDPHGHLYRRLRLVFHAVLITRALVYLKLLQPSDRPNVREFD